MISKTNLRHPNMIMKINKAMIQALKNSHEFSLSAGEVKNKKGEVVMKVFYWPSSGFLFLEEIVDDFKNVTDVVISALREYEGEVLVK